MKDSPIDASDRASVAACGCGRRLRDAVADIASSNPGSPAAISSDLPAHLRHKRSRSGFFPGDSRYADAADNPAGYRRSVVVDRWKVQKSAGSSGNTGSNSCAVPILLRFKIQTFEQNKTLVAEYRNFCRVLTASLPAGLKTLPHWLRPNRRNWLRLRPALTPGFR